MPEDEQRLRGDRAEIGVPEVGLQHHLVAEPLRLLVGVDVAAHPGQQGRVVHDLPVGLVQAHPLGQPQRDQALAQDVLQRLAHAQVGAERQHAEQFGEADVRAGGRGHSDEYKRGASGEASNEAAGQNDLATNRHFTGPGPAAGWRPGPGCGPDRDRRR
jgi:hypothetical protein